ncbi:MAG: GntR family transcriptional regulator [Propionibacteriaceae bacterium]|nr:GntR family transcriptional regulator [Propionibacteriaceae bacterium]
MKAGLRPVALGEQLAELLRGRIVGGELAPGTHLVEDALATEHDVSRGPVRDALRILTGEGLLESRRRGYWVRGFTVADIDELYQIRSAAEHLACGLALQRATEGDWAMARHYVAVMQETADRGEGHAYAKADLAFHTEFYVLSGNARLLALWRQYQPTFATLLDVTNAQDSDLHPSAHDHVRLLELAEVGDAVRFAEVLDGHLEGSRRRMKNAIASRPDLAAIS